MNDVDEVTAWPTPEHDRLIWMEGRTTGYRVDPVGEYVIGIATGPGYRLHQGRRRHAVKPHQLVVLDPSRPHSGGHSLTIDHGWRDVAQTALDFVKRFA